MAPPSKQMPVKNSGGEDCKTFLIASQFVPK